MVGQSSSYSYGSDHSETESLEIRTKWHRWEYEQNGGHFVQNVKLLENRTPLENGIEDYQNSECVWYSSPHCSCMLSHLYSGDQKFHFFSAKTPCDKCPELCMLSGKNLNIKQNKGQPGSFISH